MRSLYSRAFTPRDQRVIHRDDLRAAERPMGVLKWLALLVAIAVRPLLRGDDRRRRAMTISFAIGCLIGAAIGLVLAALLMPLWINFLDWWFDLWL